MKTILRFLALSIFAVAVQAMAAFESVKLDANNTMPQFPADLIGEGVTEGYVTFAVSISAEGKLNDSLVLVCTHQSFVPMCREAMRDWKITPARLDGENVPVQMELRFDFKREGVVETSSFNITNHFLFDRFSLAERQVAYRIFRGSELDRPPVRVTTIDPAYAKAAEKQGVRGKVQVYFYIDEKGEVRFPSVMADANPYLCDIAVTALRGWRFEPATSHGQPVMVAATQEFNFGAVQ